MFVDFLVAPWCICTSLLGNAAQQYYRAKGTVLYVCTGLVWSVERNWCLNCFPFQVLFLFFLFSSLLFFFTWTTHQVGWQNRLVFVVCNIDNIVPTIQHICIYSSKGEWREAFYCNYKQIVFYTQLPCMFVSSCVIVYIVAWKQGKLVSETVCNFIARPLTQIKNIITGKII